MAFVLQEKADDEAAEFAAAAGMPLPPGAAMASVPVPRPPPPVDEEPLILERPLKEPAPVAPTVGPTKRQRQLSAAAAFAEGQRVGREEAERPAQQRVAVVPRQSPYARRMGAPRSEEMVALQARKAAAEKAEDKKALEELTTQILKLSADGKQKHGVAPKGTLALRVEAILKKAGVYKQSGPMPPRNSY